MNRFNDSFRRPNPQPVRFFITIFQLLKPFPAHVSVFGVFISFRVDLNVVALQGVDRVSLDFFFVPHIL